MTCDPISQVFRKQEGTQSIRQKEGTQSKKGR